jgi:hypothetical protein
MKRVILILIFLLFVNFAKAEQTALAPVLEGSVVIDEYPEEEAESPIYLDFIELETPEIMNFKSSLLRDIEYFNLEAQNNDSETYFKSGNFSIIGYSKKGYDTDTLVSNLRQTTELKYSKQYFELSSGYQNKYQVSNTDHSTQYLYFNPKIKMGPFSVAFGNYAIPKSREFYQEVGLNYKSKLLKGASFNVLGGTTLKEGEISSQKLRFTTDFYLK